MEYCNEKKILIMKTYALIVGLYMDMNMYMKIYLEIII